MACRSPAGLSRTVINYDAGAQTPAAGAFAALGIALVTMAFTGWLYYLPIATLAATITVSILTLVDIPMLRQTLALFAQRFLGHGVNHRADARSKA